MVGRGWPSLRWANTCSVMLAGDRVVRGDGTNRLSLLKREVLRRFAHLEEAPNADIRAHRAQQAILPNGDRKRRRPLMKFYRDAGVDEHNQSGSQSDRRGQVTKPHEI
jgi:hypothetical protein